MSKPATQHANEVLEQVEGIFWCAICGKSQPGTKFQSEVELYCYSRHGARVRHIGKRCVDCKGKRRKVDIGRL